MLGEEASAGSARTRRSFRSSRRYKGVVGIIFQGNRYGLLWASHVECRDDSVKHTTSPSRRDCARQVCHVASVFSKSACRYRTSPCPALRRRVTSVCRHQHVHELGVPNRCGCREVPYSSHPWPAKAARHTRENSDTEQPFSYCYESPT